MNLIATNKFFAEPMQALTEAMSDFFLFHSGSNIGPYFISSVHRISENEYEYGVKADWHDTDQYYFTVKRGSDSMSTEIQRANTIPAPNDVLIWYAWCSSHSEKTIFDIVEEE